MVTVYEWTRAKLESKVQFSSSEMEKKMISEIELDDSIFYKEHVHVSEAGNETSNNTVR